MAERARASARPRVVVVGDVIEDILVTAHAPIAADTDTPSSIVVRPGGSASNAACWMAASGLVDVTFVGMVGSDDVERHTRVFAEHGVDAHLIGNAVLPTGRIVLLLDAGEGRRDMLTDRGANEEMGAERVDRSVLDGAAALHVTGYSLFGGTRETAGDAGAGTGDMGVGGQVAALIADAHDRGLIVSVDPASASGIEGYGVSRFLDAIAEADIILPNADEASVLTGTTDVDAAILALREQFPMVAVTVGSGGSVVADQEGVVAVSAEAASRVVDPTGAGDAYAAGLLVSLISGNALAQAAKVGAEFSARAVACAGGRPVG